MHQAKAMARKARRLRDRVIGRAGRFCEECGQLVATKAVAVRDQPGKPLRHLDGLEARCDLCTVGVIR